MRPKPEFTNAERDDLLARSNHTGQQPASTISDFASAVGDIAASFPSGVATITVPNNARWHEQTVAATGVLPTDRVNAWIAPHLDSDENGPDGLDVILLSAAPGTDQLAITITFGVPANGPIKLQWSAFR